MTNPAEAANAQNQRRRTLAPLALILLLLSACGGGGGGTGTNDEEIILAPQTKSLDQAATDSLVVSADRNTLTMSSSSAVAQSLAPGDLLPIGITSATPRGLLRKVTSVSQSGPNVVVTTTQGTLADTFQQAHFALHSTLGPDSFTKATVFRAGVRIVSDQSEVQARIAKIHAEAASDPCAGNSQTLMEMKDVTIAEDADGSISVNGSIEICPSFDFDWDIGGLPVSLNSLTATATLGSDVHVTVSGNYDKSFTNQVPIASLEGDPIPVTLGPVVLVIVPQVTFFIGADGTVSSSFSAGAVQSATVTGGISYEKATGTSPVLSHTAQFAADPIQVGATLSAQANAGVTLNLLVDEVAAVEVSPQGFVELDADINKNPWWTLNAGFDVPGKVAVSVFGIADLADLPFPDSLKYSTIVEQASGTANEPTVSITANPTSITAGQSSTLTWSSTNATSCNASGGWSGSKPLSGSATVSPGATITYTLTCTGTGGTTADSATVTVTTESPPTVSIAANPTSITAGQSSTLTWSSSNATSCTASGGWSGSKGTSGSTTVSPTVTTTYTLACSGIGGTSSNSATVTVTSQPQTPHVSVFHDFGATNTDCAGPSSPLIQDGQGNLYGTTVSGGGNGGGCIYGLDRNGSYISAFVRGGLSGANPYAGLSRGSDGSYYGTTSSNGVYGSGAVYRISADGTASSLYDFGGYAGDGQVPKGGVVQGSDGYLYGTTSAGGQNGTGSVFKMTTSGAEVWVSSFPGPRNFGDFATPLGDLIEATDGNLYGTASGSGDYQQGFVFRVSHSGVVTILYSFGAFADDGANPEAGVIQGGDGYLYGTTKSGGARNGGGTVFRITLSGAESVLHSFGSFGAGSDGDGSSPVAPLVQGMDGNFYGTTSEGGAGGGTSGLAPPTGTIFRITPSGDETVLWSFFGDDFRGSPPVDPQTPMAGLIQGQDGSYYGTSFGGGQYGGGTVFRLTFSGP